MSETITPLTVPPEWVDEVYAEDALGLSCGAPFCRLRSWWRGRSS